MKTKLDVPKDLQVSPAYCTCLQPLLRVGDSQESHAKFSYWESEFGRCNRKVESVRDPELPCLSGIVNPGDYIRVKVGIETL